MSKKKMPKPYRDNWSPLLIVARDSQRDAWKAAALRDGASLMDWVVAALDRSSAA